MDQVALMLMAMGFIFIAVYKKIFILLLPSALMFLYFAIEANDPLLSGIFIASMIIVLLMVAFNRD